MKTILIIVLLSLVTIFSTNTINSETKKERVIFIRPLGNVNPEYVSFVKSSIEDFYGFKCEVLSKVEVSDDILSKSKKRCDANKILTKFKTDSNIVLVTERDICQKRGKVDEYGIIGLGFCPGKVCVISTCRIKNKVTKKSFYNRLKKVTLHEMGHNLGIPHCSNSDRCLMNDAKGTVKTIDKEGLFICDKCVEKIK
jgi:archaemetzincin